MSNSKSLFSPIQNINLIPNSKLLTRSEDWQDLWLHNLQLGRSQNLFSPPFTLPHLHFPCSWLQQWIKSLKWCNQRFPLVLTLWYAGSLWVFQWLLTSPPCVKFHLHSILMSYVLFGTYPPPAWSPSCPWGIFHGLLCYSPLPQQRVLRGKLRFLPWNQFYPWEYYTSCHTKQCPSYKQGLLQPASCLEFSRQ